ncbi:hypothetical protein BC833DRAFT_605649 [Globomyces pollinis-pini]|nr:hypothetical protein BC833DRAFT_605649 [Globomyces pollinis-pini]
MQTLVLFTILAIASPLVTRSAIDKLVYDGYSLDYSCSQVTANRWTYTLDQNNKGSASRPNEYFIDPNYPEECQQTSTDSYGEGYDRGHLVASNHMDATEHSRYQANFMTNILPQESRFNKVVWRTTEVMTECYRQIKPVTVYGGVIYNDESNDYFLASHNVRTPDLWWKVLVSKDSSGKDQVISWLFPNIAGLKEASNYITTVAEIERQLNDGLGLIPIKSTLKKVKGDVTKWPTKNCDSGSF